MNLYNLEAEIIHIWHSTFFSFEVLLMFELQSSFGALLVLNWALWYLKVVTITLPLKNFQQSKYFVWPSVTAVSGLCVVCKLWSSLDKPTTQTLDNPCPNFLSFNESNLFCLENLSCSRTWSSLGVSGPLGHCLRSRRQ